MARRTAIALLAVIAASAVIVACIAGHYARRYYAELAELKLSPTFEHRYAARNARLTQPTRTRIVMFGDSRIAEWKPTPNAPDFEFVWRGVPGETTEQMLHRYRADTSAIAASIVVIEAGVNDIVAGVAIGEGQSAVERSFRNLKLMVDESLHAGAAVILVTVIPPASPPLLRRIVWSDTIYGLVSQLNEKLRTLAGPSVSVLNADRLLCGTADRLPKHMARDTLHLVPPAYMALNQELIKQLRAVSRAVQ